MIFSKTRREERLYRRFSRLSQLLKIPVPSARYIVEAFDKDGNLLQRESGISHSWNRNAYNLLTCIGLQTNMNGDTWGAGYLNSKRTNGSILYGDYGQSRIASDLESANNGYMGAAGSNGNGIVIGISNTAEDFDHYTLQSICGNGSGTNQFAYQESLVAVESYASMVMTSEYARYMNNNSGATIDVKEAGLYGGIYSYGTQYYAMYARDVLASTVSVPDSGQIKVTYIIEITYPS